MNVTPVVGGKPAKPRHRAPISVIPNRKRTPPSLNSPPSGDNQKISFDEIPKPPQNSKHVTKMAIEVLEENQKLREEMENLKKQHIREIEHICAANNGSQEEFETDPKSLLSKMMRQSLYAEDFLTESESSELSKNRVEELQMDLDKANNKISDLLNKLKQKDEMISKLQAEIRALKKGDTQPKKPLEPPSVPQLSSPPQSFAAKNAPKHVAIANPNQQTKEKEPEPDLSLAAKTFIPKKFSPRAPVKKKNSQEIFNEEALRIENTQSAKKRTRKYD